MIGGSRKEAGDIAALKSSNLNQLDAHTVQIDHVLVLEGDLNIPVMLGCDFYLRKTSQNP